MREDVQMGASHWWEVEPGGWVRIKEAELASLIWEMLSHDPWHDVVGVRGHGEVFVGFVH